MAINAKNKNDDRACERLKSLRKSFRFSRKYFYNKYGLPEITLQKWENSERNINEQSLQRILKIYKNENIEVTKEWILHGSGSEPRFIFKEDPVENLLEIDFSNNDELLINKEIEFFEKNHNNAKVIIIEDNDMSPIYKSGDYVGGCEISEDHYEKIENLDCIVLIKNQEGYILRRITNEVKNKFRLSITNKNSKNKKPVIYNAALSFVAPVIWIRRPNKFK